MVIQGKTKCPPQQHINQIHIDKVEPNAFQYNFNELRSLHTPYSLFLGSMNSSFKFVSFDFTKLAELSLFNCRIMEDCEVIFSELPNLIFFKVDEIKGGISPCSCDITEVDLTLSNLPKLKIITFGNIDYDAKIQLENLPELETIKIEGQIEDPETEAYLKNFPLKNKK